MRPRIIEAKYMEGYTLYLRFLDGSEGAINLEQELTGEIFEPLRDISFFKKFAINHDIHTLVWPNRADFFPEFLHDNLRINFLKKHNKYTVIAFKALQRAAAKVVEYARKNNYKIPVWINDHIEYKIPGVTTDPGNQVDQGFGGPIVQGGEFH